MEQFGFYIEELGDNVSHKYENEKFPQMRIY